MARVSVTKVILPIQTRRQFKYVCGWGVAAYQHRVKEEKRARCEECSPDYRDNPMDVGTG